MATVVTILVEQGKWILTLSQDEPYRAVSKHMYKGSIVTVSVDLKCDDGDSDGIEISWMLRMSPSAMEFISLTQEINNPKKQISVLFVESYMQSPVRTPYNVCYDQVEWQNGSSSHICSEEGFQLERGPGQITHRADVLKPSKNTTEDNSARSDSGSDTKASGKAAPAGAGASEKQGKSSDKEETAKPGEATSTARAQREVRLKREDSPSQTAKPLATKKPGSAAAAAAATSESEQSSGAIEIQACCAVIQDKVNTGRHNLLWDIAQAMDKFSKELVLRIRTGDIKLNLTTVWNDGNYLFIIRVRPKTKTKFTATVTIRMFYGDDNYISAMDYPLLIFYGLMGLVYIVYGLVWLVLLACNWRDLLRVQFWVGGVILLGMLEKAVFFAEYENINKTGVSVRGAVIFAELVSCLKRTLARMLVIIVSLGFGIVKPRLGQTFHKVLFVGALYFILASIEGCMRATTPKADQSNQFLLAAVPLAVLEAIICCLIQTTRTLRLRRNVVKLTLYRHFTNTLIFAVLASVACMIWSMTQHKFKECVKDWQQLWVDEAFWHMLFIILLLIIMLLWRPTVNNQRYAFSPLLDAADEEDDEDALMNDAFEGMKMRGAKSSNGSPKPQDAKSKVEDDLKWVEENIPSSMADKALPTLLDSDEELMTTKFEMSKME
ncbi:hypothetical protein ACOMHN_019676 [Nucella lapillus]